MPNQLATNVENNFTKGFVTEYHGLNFPENAVTSCDNVEFTIVGDVIRRLGLDYEDNNVTASESFINHGTNTYKWNNAGGDGSTQLVVVQVGSNLHFYSVTNSTIASPLSANKLVSIVDLSPYRSGTFDGTKACEFTDGNGYLFVFHENLNPVYCTYSSGAVTANQIVIKIRDLAGIAESGVDDNTRPSALTDVHKYNLQNQGWISGNPWATTSTSSVTVGLGARVFTVPTGLPISAGQTVVAGDIDGLAGGTKLVGYRGTVRGTVTSYVGTTLTLAVTYTTGSGTYANWSIFPIVISQITTWNTAVGNYPSNADQWWRFKNTNQIFDPATTQSNTSIGLGAAPKGHYLLDAFNQDRSTISGISNLTNITTTKRPTHGCWFQGRVWYSGVNASQAASGTAPFYSWSENIYFSQVVQKTDDFGKCYSTNDQTSEELFDLLPTDGGVVVIPGSGPIYKLFPTVNGLLVFAANGVWFLTGSQGIAFSATDYAQPRISGVQSISTTSFVDVLGLPYFWNEEGIYAVEADQQGNLKVNILTHDTIDTFYAEIPLEAKKNARGAYHPIDYVITWVYKSSDSASVTDRYRFDKALNLNTALKAFYPYSFNTGSSGIYISGITYISGPGGISTIDPVFKFLATTSTTMSFAEFNSTNYADWPNNGGVDTDGSSFFVTGYRVHGKAQFKYQVPYIYIYSRTDGGTVQYKIQSIWDYANTGDSGRWSTAQYLVHNDPKYDVMHKRVPLRGRGYAMQLKFKSVVGQPFDFIGWSTFEAINQGV